LDIAIQYGDPTIIALVTAKSSILLNETKSEPTLTQDSSGQGKVK